MGSFLDLEFAVIITLNKYILLIITIKISRKETFQS